MYNDDDGSFAKDWNWMIRGLYYDLFHFGYL